MTREHALKMLATNRYVTVRVPEQPYNGLDPTHYDDYHRIEGQIREAQRSFFTLFEEGLAILCGEHYSNPHEKYYEITRVGLQAYQSAQTQESTSR